MFFSKGEEEETEWDVYVLYLWHCIYGVASLGRILYLWLASERGILCQ